jgi:exodeoxyribonuclease V gamma subunit
VSARLATESDAPAQLTLEALTERIVRSTRFYARNVLGLRLPRVESALGDFDPVELEALEQYRLGHALLEDLEAGASIQEGERRLAASAVMPAGVPGRLAARRLCAEAAEIVRVARRYRVGERLPDRSFELCLPTADPIGSARLTGTLRDLWPGGRIQVDFARLEGRGELELWIQHLVLCAGVAEGAAPRPRSVLIARPATSSSSQRVVRFEPVDAPLELLATLFEWAWSVDRAPLPLFPRSSRRYAHVLARAGPRQASREAIGQLFGWESQNFQRPEIDREPEAQRVWEGWSPLDASTPSPVLFRFDEVARRFYEPLLAVRQEADE